MTIVTSRVSQSCGGEVLSLPEEVAFGRDLEVTIERSGNVLTVYPGPPSHLARPSVAEMLATLDALPKPSEIQERDDIWPERPGL
jgi:antitoxin VapB